VIGKLFVDLQSFRTDSLSDRAIRLSFSVLETIVQTYKPDLSEEFLKLMQKISPKTVHWMEKANMLDDFLDGFDYHPIDVNTVQYLSLSLSLSLSLCLSLSLSLSL